MVAIPHPLLSSLIKTKFNEIVVGFFVPHINPITLSITSIMNNSNGPLDGTSSLLLMYMYMGYIIEIYMYLFLR